MIAVITITAAEAAVRTSTMTGSTPANAPSILRAGGIMCRDANGEGAYLKGGR